MQEGHPTFPNPTVEEAVCEIHFQMPQGEGWKLTFVGELFKLISIEYPEMEDVTSLDVKLQTSLHGISQTVTPSRPRIRFKHKSRDQYVMLNENTLTVDVLKPYPGWHTVLEDTISAWEQAQRVVHAEAITRIGLRYINAIPTNNEEASPGLWLMPGDYIPPGVLESMPGFLSRTQVQLDAQNRIIITVADIETESAQSQILLDIDRISEQRTIPDKARLTAQLDSLHESVWNVFQSTWTPKLMKLLKENVDEQ